MDRPQHFPSIPSFGFKHLGEVAVPSSCVLEVVKAEAQRSEVTSQVTQLQPGSVCLSVPEHAACSITGLGLRLQGRCLENPPERPSGQPLGQDDAQSQRWK